MAERKLSSGNPDQRPSRAERRRQVRLESEKRTGRNFLTRNKSRSLLVAAGAITALFLGVNLIRPSQGSETQAPPAATATISAHPLRDKLVDWDNQIAAGSSDFLTIAPQIADLASQTLCAEMKCDPSYEKPPLDLQNNRGFKRTIYLDDPCTTFNPDDDSPAPEPAFSRPLSGTIFFNVDLLQYSNMQQKIRRQNTATHFFQIYMHEELHNRAKRIEAKPGELVFVPEENEAYPLLIRRGFRTLYRSHKYYSRSEEGCVVGISHERLIEEAVVDYANQEILLKAGLILPSPYQNLIQQYRVRILNPFFGGDYKATLKFHQNTDQTGFYLALGEGIARQRGVVLSPDQQISEAKSYIAGALNLSLQ